MVKCIEVADWATFHCTEAAFVAEHVLMLPLQAKVTYIDYTPALPSKVSLLVAVVHGFPVPLPEDILLGGCDVQVTHNEHLQVHPMRSSCCLLAFPESCCLQVSFHDLSMQCHVLCLAT